MKVVIDTNVFVSSFFGGNPRKIIDMWKQGKLTLCLSKEIISEYTTVLNRIGLENQKELKEIFSLFARGIHSVFSGKTPALKVVIDDPDDDKFIECAVALKAEYIISGDKDLLEVSEYMGIKILNPREFLNREFVYGN
ncbi:MAG: putative toxin-antitoxin system toxin component, PIN family [Proteobacteria bacterium]|nr:putative toxin-antitoxin system toxin component, PIN family [Pseudomonadota bacterium]